ncbi:MAG: FHA domain-containing protein [Chloroflexi bacterium]|nr:FHA domain-containing protein [Chloroflexota bacterium]
MQNCPHCGKENPETDAYCYACGHILPSALPVALRSTTKLEEVYESLEPRRRWGTAYFDQRTKLRLTFRDTNETLLIDVPHQIVLGRRGEDPTPNAADVDLTPYRALETGVSRRHLEIIREHDTVTVIDLNSANGTFLNGQKLMANEPRILRDNDELRLGRLVIRVSFS